MERLRVGRCQSNTRRYATEHKPAAAVERIRFGSYTVLLLLYFFFVLFYR